MKVGIIDIGTNTFHLLIADRMSDMKVLYKEKVPVQLGKGGITQNVIRNDAMQRAVATLKGFKIKMEASGVDEYIVSATSAVRNATNQKEFIAHVAEQTGFDIHVLSGEEEARLIQQGVSHYVDFEKQTGLIVDIGGGSIECIVAGDEGIQWLRSYEIGGQRLIDQFHRTDPISDSEKMYLEAFLLDTLSEVFEACTRYGARFLVGSSGSFDTFWDIHARKPHARPMEKPVLYRTYFEEIHQELIRKNREERLSILGMIPMRVDMIVSASMVTKVIMDQCGFDKIKISPYALKEGLLYYGLPKRK